MKGLISRGLRIVTNTSDGASVERDCQRRLATASRQIEFTIRSDVPGHDNLKLTLHDMDGNIFVNQQDSKHALKTFRNNIFTGARAVTLGNYTVHYQQVRELAFSPDSPLYIRDVEKYDKQDDNAASRLFSAAILEQASSRPEDYMGFIVYDFVFGEFIDAFQCRTMNHCDRARIAIRTGIFLETWRMFLKKQGYIEARHFISKEAYDICKMLQNGLLGSMIVYRDHIPKPMPFVPWKLVSEGNEHQFSGWRKLPDFSMVQAVLMVPRLQGTELSLSESPFGKKNYKAQANGYQHTYLHDGKLDYDLLSALPSDADLTAAYRAAIDENDALWTLLGIHPTEILEAPTPTLAPLLVDQSPDIAEEDIPIADEDQTTLEQLQTAIDAIETTFGLTREEDNEVEACTFAAIALSLQELAQM